MTVQPRETVRNVAQNAEWNLKRVWALLHRYFWTIPNYNNLKSAFASIPLDILHINNGGYPGAWSAQWAGIAAKSVGIPVCVMTVANTPTGPRTPAFIERILDHRVAYVLDAFVVVAKEVGRVLIEKHRFPAEKMHVIYYGVEPAQKVPSETDQAVIRREFGLSHASRVIGMTARLDPVKGHVWLLQALAALRESLAGKVEALIIGGGPLLDEIKRCSVELGLDQVVKFTGPLLHTDVLRAMAACDIVTLPSDIEGLPYVVIEAMSLKKPVVATSVGGIPEQVLDGKTGFVVPPRDPKALAHALWWLVSNPDEARQMGEAAYLRYLSLFALQRMIQQHDTLYQKLYKRVLY